MSETAYWVTKKSEISFPICFYEVAELIHGRDMFINNSPLGSTAH